MFETFAKLPHDIKVVIAEHLQKLLGREAPKYLLNDSLYSSKKNKDNGLEFIFSTPDSIEKQDVLNESGNLHFEQIRSKEYKKVPHKFLGGEGITYGMYWEDIYSIIDVLDQSPMDLKPHWKLTPAQIAKHYVDFYFKNGFIPIRPYKWDILLIKDKGRLLELPKPFNDIDFYTMEALNKPAVKKKILEFIQDRKLVTFPRQEKL
jgi:hypothetical protein